jgi:hypothetical protein
MDFFNVICELMNAIFYENNAGKKDDFFYSFMLGFFIKLHADFYD